MNEYLIIILFLAWYFLSLAVSETTGKKSKIGVEWSFFLSFILSPLVGFIATKYIK